MAGPHEPFEEPIQLGLVGKGDLQMSPFAAPPDLDARTEARPEAFLGGARVRVLRWAGSLLTRGRRAKQCDASLYLAGGQSLLHRLTRQAQLLLGVLQGEERARMSRIEAALVDERLHFGRQAEQA